jgi:UDP:flavonoid glycosyltransferase YjiC (YdhE family)
MKNPNILFLTNGLGLGNSTRCHAIIQRLHAGGAHIEVVTSGNGLWYFSDKPEVSRLHEIQSLAYGSKDGAISITRTFASVGEMIGIFRRNAKKIGNLLDDLMPDVVVTDSDYNFFPIKSRRIPIAALNNADVVWNSYFQFKDHPSSIRAQFYGVEMLDYQFHKRVPDLVLSPSLDPSIPQSGGNILRIGPIVRQEYAAPPQTTPPMRATVMLSGSVFGTPVNFSRSNYPVKIDVIGRNNPEGWIERPEVTFHGKIIDTYPFLKNTDIAVVNGGFSAVSEMFWMKKPLVVVPVPNHAEQWINARTIERLGLGLIATQTNYEEVMIQAIKQIEEFRAGYAQLADMKDGAAQASKAILELASGTV